MSSKHKKDNLLSENSDLMVKETSLEACTSFMSSCYRAIVGPTEETDNQDEQPETFEPDSHGLPENLPEDNDCIIFGNDSDDTDKNLPNRCGPKYRFNSFKASCMDKKFLDEMNGSPASSELEELTKKYQLLNKREVKRQCNNSTYEMTRLDPNCSWRELLEKQVKYVTIEEQTYVLSEKKNNELSDLEKSYKIW